MPRASAALGLLGLAALPSALPAVAQQPSPPRPLEAAWFDVSAAHVAINTTCERAHYAKCIDYEAQALLYTLQGLTNRERPRLLFNLGAGATNFSQIMPLRVLSHLLPFISESSVIIHRKRRLPALGRHVEGLFRAAPQCQLHHNPAGPLLAGGALRAGNPHPILAILTSSSPHPHLILVVLT